MTGEPGGSTIRVGVSLIDYATAWWAALGVLAALGTRERHVVEVSLFETALALAGYHVADALAGDEPRKHGSAFPHIAPYQVFRTADGEVMLAVGNDRLYGELARRLELPDDDRFETNSSRVLHREGFARLVQERLGREPTGVWLERLDSIPIAPVQTIREAAEHPQTLALGMLQAFAGRQQRLAEPLRVDGERVRVDTPPPALGEH